MKNQEGGGFCGEKSFAVHFIDVMILKGSNGMKLKMMTEVHYNIFVIYSDHNIYHSSTQMLKKKKTLLQWSDRLQGNKKYFIFAALHLFGDFNTYKSL